MADATDQPTEGPRLTALTVDQVVALLHQAGSTTMTPERIAADLAAGAPVNADQTINLIAYGAWLVRALAHREQSRG